MSTAIELPAYLHVKYTPEQEASLRSVIDWMHESDWRKSRSFTDLEDSLRHAGFKASSENIEILIDWFDNERHKTSLERFVAEVLEEDYYTAVETDGCSDAFWSSLDAHIKRAVSSYRGSDLIPENPPEDLWRYMATYLEEEHTGDLSGDFWDRLHEHIDYGFEAYKGGAR